MHLTLATWTSVVVRMGLNKFVHYPLFRGFWPISVLLPRWWDWLSIVVCEGVTDPRRLSIQSPDRTLLLMGCVFNFLEIAKICLFPKGILVHALVLAVTVVVDPFELRVNVGPLAHQAKIIMFVLPAFGLRSSQHTLLWFHCEVLTNPLTLCLSFSLQLKKLEVMFDMGLCEACFPFSEHSLCFSWIFCLFTTWIPLPRCISRCHWKLGHLHVSVTEPAVWSHSYVLIHLLTLWVLRWWFYIIRDSHRAFCSFSFIMSTFIGIKDVWGISRFLIRLRDGGPSRSPSRSFLTRCNDNWTRIVSFPLCCFSLSICNMEYLSMIVPLHIEHCVRSQGKG